MPTTYNSSLATIVQKPIGISKSQPIDARSYFYDQLNFIYRPYASLAEALAYLNDPVTRRGHFPVVINTGGTIDSVSGYITGGTNKEYWFKDGVNNSDLIYKSTDITQTQANSIGTVPSLQSVLTSGNDSISPIKVSSVFIKGPISTNMTEIDTNATTATRKVMLPDNSGTLALSVNGSAPDSTTGDITLNVYTKTETYTKLEVDGLVGSGTGGTAGVTTFNSRSGAVTPTSGDYSKSDVGLGNVDNTSDSTKNSAVATLTNKTLTSPKISTILNGTATLTLPTTTGTVALTSDLPSVTLSSLLNTLGVTTLSGSNTGDQDLSGYVTKVTGKSLVSDTEITKLAGLANVSLTQGSGITITGTYPSLTIAAASSGGSGGATTITVAAGTNSVSVPQGRLISTMVFLGASDTISAGWSAGSKELVDTFPFTNKLVLQVIEYFETTKTIYFTKSSTTSVILF